MSSPPCSSSASSPRWWWFIASSCVKVKFVSDSGEDPVGFSNRCVTLDKVSTVYEDEINIYDLLRLHSPCPCPRPIVPSSCPDVRSCASSIYTERGFYVPGNWECCGHAAGASSSTYKKSVNDIKVE